MYEIKADLIKNRLYITFRKLGGKGMTTFVNRLAKACSLLTPGFTCIASFHGNKAAKKASIEVGLHAPDFTYPGIDG
jgi:hypothetical protein